jgi:cysteine desulfurase/selenocysteine lyase
MTATPFDAEILKKDFPLLERTIRGGKKLVYLDSGATSQKPRIVLDAERNFYEEHNAAAHRGAHQLAEEATEAFEGARVVMAEFIGAQSREVVFTKSATESLNLIAYSLSATESPIQWRAGDEVLLTEMEHHANLIPWQEMAKRTGATLRFIPVTDDGLLDLTDINTLINEKTRILSFMHASNVLGTVNPVRHLADLAHAVGAIVVLDACQSVPHESVDVVALGIDLMAFSGHKMLGPTGVGVLWGRYEILESMPPFLTGGSMIEVVTLESATYSLPPKRFEAGVPNMAQAVGLAAAIGYLQNVGMDAIAQHESELVTSAIRQLEAMPGVKVLGPAGPRGGAVSFLVDEIHPHDVGQVLDDDGIAVRVGHHCAWPLMRRYGVAATTRATFYLYNTHEDVASLISGVKRAQQFFGTAS